MLEKKMEIVEREVEKPSSVFGKRKGKEREAWETRETHKTNERIGKVEPGTKSYEVK